MGDKARHFPEVTKSVAKHNAYADNLIATRYINMYFNGTEALFFSDLSYETYFNISFLQYTLREDAKLCTIELKIDNIFHNRFLFSLK